MNPEFIKKLRCPVTKKPLRYDAEKQELISEEAQLAYPIKDGIPILLKEQARSLASHDK
ncbi:Trm112 family protein [Pelistega ratti]|uniref:Trm112 family protein n=1 Tax=Pelistega ratti TaxID=2652177 RepID=UPI00135B1C15|nr:Trm112 family protein [Pelistega ratti]